MCIRWIEKGSKKRDTHQTVTWQILINSSHSSPIKVANEWNSGRTERIFRWNNAEKVWIVFNCVNGIRVCVGDLFGFEFGFEFEFVGGPIV